MKKEYIPHELCVKLYELGYDYKAFDYYIKGTYSSFGSKRYKVPKILRQQAFRWFREQGIFGTVEVDVEEMSYSYFITFKKSDVRIECSITFPTHEEAELECIYSITNILIERMCKNI